MQAVCPASLWNWPLSHATQAWPAVGLTAPGGQGAHWEPGSPALSLPAGQVAHSTAPSSLEWSTGQSAQKEVLAAAANVPARQNVHWMAPAVSPVSLPASHGWQAWVASEKAGRQVPAAHAAQATAP